MNATNSGSPLQIFASPTIHNTISLGDVITYAFERRSSKKQWVRAFLYAAIWSLENGPINDLHLPISPISLTQARICQIADDFTRLIYIVADYAVDDRFSRQQMQLQLSGRKTSENYANRFDRKTHTVCTDKTTSDISQTFTAAPVLSGGKQWNKMQRIRFGCESIFNFHNTADVTAHYNFFLNFIIGLIV
jgi:hypothetical protein